MPLAVALPFEQALVVKIHKRDQKSKREVRELLVNLVNLLNLVGHVLDRLKLRPTLRRYGLLDMS